MYHSSSSMTPKRVPVQKCTAGSEARTGQTAHQLPRPFAPRTGFGLTPPGTSKYANMYASWQKSNATCEDLENRSKGSKTRCRDDGMSCSGTGAGADGLLALRSTSTRRDKLPFPCPFSACLVVLEKRLACYAWPRADLASLPISGAVTSSIALDQSNALPILDS